MTPRFPEISAELSAYYDKPIGFTAAVRRALQRAGHRDEAKEFTEKAFAASSAEEVLAIAREYINVL